MGTEAGGSSAAVSGARLTAKQTTIKETPVAHDEIEGNEKERENGMVAVMGHLASCPREERLRGQRPPWNPRTKDKEPL
jgi:hypothetical protein